MIPQAVNSSLHCVYRFLPPLSSILTYAIRERAPMELVLTFRTPYRRYEGVFELYTVYTQQVGEAVLFGRLFACRFAWLKICVLEVVS